MQVLDSQKDLHKTIPGFIFAHPPHLSQVVKEFSPGAVYILNIFTFKSEGHEVFCLECEL